MTSLGRLDGRSTSLVAAVLVLALGALLGRGAPLGAAGPLCTVDAGGGGDYTTIQAAVNDPGCTTIQVAGGTYVEQVEITRPLVLQGAGASTVVQSPDSLTKFFTTSTDNYPIIYVHDTADVTIRDLVVDGAGKGQDNYRFIGIAFYNAEGTVTDVEVKDIRDTPLSGRQHGVGIYAFSQDGVGRTVTVQNNTIHGFQKNGITLNATPDTPLTVDVRGNTITGAGANNIIAQNGIQVWASQGSGTLADNTITGIAYDNTANPIKWVATSILNLYADLTIQDNTIAQGHVGIYSYDGSGQIVGNDLSIEKVGVAAWGIIATDPPQAVPQPFDQMGSTQGRAGTRAAKLLTVAVDRNTVRFNGSDNTSTFGVEADAGWGVDDLSFTASYNTITGFDVGVEIFACQSNCAPGVFTQVVATCNQIEDNTIGMRSNVPYLTVNAEMNWWGDPSGPSGLGPGLGDPVYGDIDFTPWNTERQCPTTAIDLVSFSGKAQGRKVVLRWQTGTELDNAGFRIYRADVARREWVQVNPGLIPAQGNEVQGATYEFVDTPGIGRFYYVLEDVDLQGVATRHGPISVRVGEFQELFLPMVQR